MNNLAGLERVKNSCVLDGHFNNIIISLLKRRLKKKMHGGIYLVKARTREQNQFLARSLLFFLWKI